MQAKTQLHVTDGMKISVQIDMTVEEMRTLLKKLEGVSDWPIYSLKAVLAQSLRLANDTYTSEHTVSA